MQGNGNGNGNGKVLSFTAHRQRAAVALGAEDVCGGAAELRDEALRLGNARLAQRMEAIRAHMALTRQRIERSAVRAARRMDDGPRAA